MKRWHEDYFHCLKHWKRFQRSYKHDLSIGRFRKRKSFDCGNSRCHMCHSDKFPKRELTKKEIISSLNLKEQKNENRL